MDEDRVIPTQALKQFVMIQGDLYYKAAGGSLAICVNKKGSRKNTPGIARGDMREDRRRPSLQETLEVRSILAKISKRSSTGASPYSLVYGEDAILPAEIAVPSARVAMASHIKPDETSRFAHLDTIEERRSRAERFEEAYRKRAANYYNQSVKEKTFKVDDLVLKIAPHVQRNASVGKFAANWEGPFKIRKVADSGYYKLRRMNGTKVKSPINGKWLKKFHA
ncbi:uncharacterized protein LOC113316163 [Papaver somniferum]|uniref:uncharacterized protein LOC113316163 n=1 Tax=Papaver somniferum TaxID=3469 RepID=UPI000E7002F5|nr:uncharacterized protein LOC113316163 [Papaver somniferum]